MTLNEYLCDIFNLRCEFDITGSHFATHENEREDVEEDRHVFTESIDMPI